MSVEKKYPLPDLLEDCFIFLMAKVYQKAHSNFKRQLQQYDLTPMRHLVLEALWDEEGLTAGEIARRLVLDNATLSGVIDRMEKTGWIVKQADPGDKRAMQIFLTAKAKEMKSPILEERIKANEESLSPLSLKEKVFLKRLLKDLL
ncbi:MAG TPA: MarR family transcriptional regulator [Deltaproteobacteria bacterium]|nr:MarR family transcriptional regulator [Deltaproteobacteria bacterium]MBW2112034.1 MarR family transcriptional regulator [Deltaproteobacteria bacterium]MBW2353189.1 MarR family transcriptional regulator [Deltaproteobacteria bacterium]HDH98397.1 MarR family transcriptional regulator [Deltaproteobacteria bacterium]